MPEDFLPLAPEAASPNGREPDSFEARLLADLEGAVGEKAREVADLEADVERVKAKLADARAAYKRYEDMRHRILGEPLTKRPRGRPRLSGEPVRPVQSKQSPERIAVYREAIARYAETHDEFAQVDIRSTLGGPEAHSGQVAQGFETLRQEGFIRLARVDGNRKLFRLTRAAIAK